MDTWLGRCLGTLTTYQAAFLTSQVHPQCCHSPAAQAHYLVNCLQTSRNSEGVSLPCDPLPYWSSSLNPDVVYPTVERRALSLLRLSNGVVIGPMKRFHSGWITRYPSELVSFFPFLQSETPEEDE